MEQQVIFFSVNPTAEKLILGNIVQFWMLALIGLVIGFAFYRLLSLPPAVNEKFKQFFEKSRLSRWQVGSALGALLLAAFILYFATDSYDESFSEDPLYYGLLVLLALAGAMGLMLLIRGVACTRIRAAVFGFSVTLLIWTIAYQINWAGFYILVRSENHLSLTYFYPQRTVTIASFEVRSMYAVDSYRGSRYLAIETAGGRKYKSNRMYRAAFNRQFGELRNWGSRTIPSGRAARRVAPILEPVLPSKQPRVLGAKNFNA